MRDALRSAMEKTLNRFTDKYNRINIFAKKSKYFKEFQREMENVFKDLDSKSEDQLKLSFKIMTVCIFLCTRPLNAI